MTLPLWLSDDPDEQQALARFVLNELDKADALAASGTASDADIRWLRSIAELNSQAKRVGLTINLPVSAADLEEELDDFQRAVLDVHRIRGIFRLHYGKRNRTKPPLAEQIAAERWELSASDTAKLIDKFQRKTTVSQRSRA